MIRVPFIPSVISGSLRLRFLLAITLWTVVGIGTIWYSAARVFAAHIEQSYHEELSVHVRELARLTRIGPDGQPMLLRPLSDPRYEVPLSGFYWQVTIPGRRPLRSASMIRGRLEDEVAHSPQITHLVEMGPTGPAITYGLITVGTGGQQMHIVIGTDQAELDRVIDGFTRDLTALLVMLGAILLATGVAIIGFGLRPLARLGQSIARLRRGEAEQLEGDYPAEIAPLVGDLNAYVRQNGDMIARARVQAGNLAHSLRTPLAVITDEAERLAQRDGGHAASSVLLDQARMMEQQIDYQLARARSASGGRKPGSVSHLPTLLVPILNAMHRLHPDVAYDLPDHDGGVGSIDVALALDPVDLSELLSILLDNAGKWASSKVSLILRRSGDDTLDMVIADDGPGMTDTQIAMACEVGTRFDHDMPGSGLGLAIARDICQSMGVEMQLEPGNPGLVATVHIPPHYVIA